MPELIVQGFIEHILPDGCRLFVGRLPPDLIWDENTFALAWNLHPATKHRIRMVGRVVETPRWQQAYGADYRYTGQVNRALPVPALLEPLRAWARAVVDGRLNGFLLNWYEGPSHYIGPHHDSMVDLDQRAPIVTGSYGETRVFRLSQGKGALRETRDFPASHGTVFIMPSTTNRVWKHSVPKSAAYSGRRISVTLRGFTEGYGT